MPTALASMRALSDMQREFVRNVVKYGNLMKAAADAGYAAPSTDAYRLMRLPHVLKAIDDERSRMLRGELVSIAVVALKNMLTSDDTPAAQRLGAIKLTFEAGGVTGKNNDSKSLDGKALSEMTLEEIQMYAAKASAALDALRHPTIEGAPDNAQFTDVDDETPQET